jgi:hypothetical protein
MFEVRPGPDDRDHVFIPDEHAGELLFNNEPIVPTYIWSAVCPPGMRVNDILLADRGGETHASDLWLPTEWGSEKENPGPGDVPSPGVFPPDDFHWTSIELPDGGAEVVLTVHPFQYDYYAREATFWRNWAFDLDLVESAVAIDEVQTVTHTVTANGEQIITVTCSNGGPATEHVDLILSINDMANAVVYNVTRTVSIAPRGVERVDVPWEVSGHSPGDHQVTVRTRHAETGKELDVAYTRFRVGVPDVRVGSPYFHSTEQGIIGDGEQVVLGMEVESAGDVPVSGTSYLQIRRTTDGLILDEWESGFYDLEPFHGHDYNLVWDSTGTPHGEYELLGWAVHDGGITDIASIPFRTMENMRFAWWMAKDVYQPGEKIVATGELYDPSGKAIGPADSILPGLFFWDIPWMIPLVSQHSFEPHYSTSFFVTAAQPTGPYALAVIAGKTGYRSTLGGRWFVVTDQGFPMWAEPPICVADGISSVTVTTGTVVQGTFVVPDGTRMTVHTWGGRILEEDVDPADGHQVASEGGHFTFHWQAPPTTSLDSFVFGTLGDNQPMSGVTVRFKGIDFNGNRWVDVSDIVRVVAAEGLSFGAGDYDYRLDVNEEGIINEEDSFTVAERWSLELAEGVRYATAVPTPGQFGVTLRPEPQTAVIPPGGEIAIAIVADGLDDFGGFEFGCGLFGEALTFAAPPEYTPALETTGNFILPFEPQPTDFGYRIGAYARGGHAGPVGSATVAMLFLHAPQEGETSLILSDPVFVRTDGVEQAVKRSIEGVYIVGEPIPTPTITPTVPAPTVTPTLPVSTPTVTPTGTPEPKSSDFNGDSAVNELDLLTLMRWFHTDAVDYDLNNDHYVDSEDLFLFCHHWQEEYQKPEPE